MVVTLGHSAKLKSILLLCICADLWCVGDRERERVRENGDRPVERGWRELWRVRGI